MIKCPVNNVFHESNHGCYFMLDDKTGLFRHVFNNTMASQKIDAVQKFLHQCDNNVDYETVHLNSLGARVFTGLFFLEKKANATNEYMCDFVPLMDSLLADVTPTVCREQLYQLFKFYFKETLSFNDQIYYMHTKNFLDGYKLSDNMYRYFRPVHFIRNMLDILQGWRNNLICILEAVQAREKNATANSDCDSDNLNDHHNVGHRSNVAINNVRNLKRCNIRQFLSRPPTHLRCGQYVKKKNGQSNECNNLNFFKNSTSNIIGCIKSSKENEKCYLCIHVLKWLIDPKGGNYSETSLAQDLAYNCQISELSMACTSLFGRLENLHGILCCPNVLINSMYKKSLEFLLENKEKRRFIKKKSLPAIYGSHCSE